MSAVDDLVDRVWPPVFRRLTRYVLEPPLGTSVVRTTEWLHDFWRWSDQRRAHWRAEQLALVVDHARQFVPRYRGLPSEGVDLVELPIVDKATIRTDIASYTSTGPHVRWITKRTGGSTGDPWVYELDRRAFSAVYAAQLYRFEQTGYRYGDRRLYLGAPTSLGLHDVALSKKIRLMLERNSTRCTGLAIDDATSTVRAVRASDQGAELWYGYASAVAAIASVVDELGLRLDGPPAIFTMAEKLQPAWAATIRSAFPTTELVEEYGCNDGGVLAYSCPAGNLHIAENVSLVEILRDDGSRCAPGEEGEVTVTNLHARRIPFLRYQIGDRAVLGPDRCECGRPGATIAEVRGRSGDRVRLPRGEEYGASAFTQPFKITPDVRKWQVVQRALDRLEVRLDVTSGFDRDQRTTIESYFQRLAGPDVHIVVLEDAPILRTDGGKHRVVVSETDTQSDQQTGVMT